MGSIADKMKAKIQAKIAQSSPVLAASAALPGSVAVRRQLEDAGVVTPQQEVVVTEPKDNKKPKLPTKVRQCCGTVRKSPHLETCRMLQPPKPKRAKRPIPDMRLVHGSEYLGIYDADHQQWHIRLMAEVGGELRTWEGVGSNHDRTLHELAQKCREAMVESLNRMEVEVCGERSSGTKIGENGD